MRLLNKIRDLLYDLFSTILILGVLALALLLVFNRINHLLTISSQRQEGAPDKVYVQMEKSQPVSVTLPEGAKAEEIADILHAADIIEDPAAFAGSINKAGIERIVYGDHLVQPGLSDRDIIEVLCQNQP